MTTLTKSFSESSASTGASAYDRFIESIRFSYFGIICITGLVGSCLGGITAMYVLQDHAPIWQLCINIYITMASNIAAIGQAPLKWVVGIFSLSVLTNIVLLLVHAL